MQKNQIDSIQKSSDQIIVDDNPFGNNNASVTKYPKNGPTLDKDKSSDDVLKILRQKQDDSNNKKILENIQITEANSEDSIILGLEEVSQLKCTADITSIHCYILLFHTTEKTV